MQLLQRTPVTISASSSVKSAVEECARTRRGPGLLVDIGRISQSLLVDLLVLIDSSTAATTLACRQPKGMAEMDPSIAGTQDNRLSLK